jgi:OFA family oxalate/formate antiporter-like MFS transporter
MLGPGALCAYGLLVQPLIAGLGWSMVAGVWPFALASCFFGIGALLGGFWLEREDPRRVALVGVGMWAVGNALCGLAFINMGLVWLYFGYGVLGGLGCGAAYIAALSTITQWFPDKPGLGSGLATMGFGLGGFAYALALAHWPPYAATAHMQPRELGSTMMEVMIASGILLLLLGAWALFLEEPPEDDSRFVPIGVQTSPSAMVRHPQFYIQWSMLLLNATAGVALIANAAPIITEFSGLPGSAAADRYLLPAFAGCIGGLFWGMLSDQIEHRLVFGLLFGLQSIVFFALGSIRHPLVLSIALAIVFFCYGGGFGTMSAFHLAFFGAERFSAKYAIVLTAWACAGLFAPLFYAEIKDLTGSYAAALQPIGLLLLVAVIFPIIAERANPERRPSEAASPQPARRLHAPHH